MAETSGWAHAAGLRDARKMEQIEQLLRGTAAASNGNQQRSLSSGRHPRLVVGSALQGQTQAATGTLHGGLEGAPQATGQSPRPRSISVGRQHLQEELVNVMFEISSKGQAIRNMAKSSQEQHGASGLERRALVGDSSSDGRCTPAGTGNNGSGPATAANSVSIRSYTTPGATGPGSAAAAAAVGNNSMANGLRGTSGGAGGSSASGKGVTRSILGGVESLTNKLEMLGGRLTPRKGSPRTEHLRDTSVGRRNTTSSGEGPNFRDMLAEVNAGLLQGHGLLDTVQGSRDQRPSGTSVVLSSLAPDARPPFDPHSRRSSVTGGGVYNNTAAVDMAATLIRANHQQRAEYVLATDRMLENLQAQIRGASSGGGGNGNGSGGGGSGGGGSGSGAGLPAVPEAPSSSVVTFTVPVPPKASQTLSSAVLESAGGAPSGGGGGVGEGAANRSGSAPRRRVGSGAASGGGMLQSFLATLSEAMPLPQTPDVRGGGGSDHVEARLVPPMQTAHQGPGGMHVPAPPASATRGGAPSGSSASSPASGMGGPRPAHNQHRFDAQQRQQQQLQRHQHHQQRQLRQSPLGCPSASLQQQQQQQQAPPLTERSTTGGASVSTTDLDATLDQRLKDLQRLTRNIAQNGHVHGVSEVDSSGGSAAVTSGGGGEAAAAAAVLASTRGMGERRDAPAAAAAAAAAAPTRGLGTSHFLLGPRSAWLEDAAAAALAAAGGSGWTAATTAGAVSGAAAAGAAGRTGGARPHVGHPCNASAGGRSGIGGGLMSGGYMPVPAPPQSQSQQTPGASYGSQQAEEGFGLEGLNMTFLMQQRRKDKARREELGAVEAAAAAARARQDTAQMQAQHDTIMTRYLAERQRAEEVEAELERVSKEGCNRCARRMDQMQQLSDLAANTAAQLRDLQSQLQDARTREEVLRRQMEHTAAAMSDQAAIGARQRTTFELALQEFLSLLEPSVNHHNSSAAGSASGGRSAGQDGGDGGGGHPGADVESLIDALRTRLREHGEAVRRHREMLEAMEGKLKEERAAAATAREAASTERAGVVALASQQASFQRERAEALQAELGRQRELMSKLEQRVRQVEDERERAVRQRDAAELSLQAQQAQLEAAQQQQDTLVGRLYDGQRAREDAEVLQAQIRSLGRQLEEARAGAARSEALERKATSDREAREELDARLAALQSQLGEREAALESSRRRVRELESAANSAVASRQVATEEVSKRSVEVRTLTSENARMFHLLDRLQQDKRAADAEIQKLTAQAAALQQEAAALRTELATAREQLASAKESAVVRDATLAQHQLSADLASSRSEVAALRAAHEAASEYAQAMARSLRQHGLTPPPPPSSADVTCHIGELQAKLAAESSALAVAKAEVLELRQQLADARADVERLKRESQSLTDRYSQLEAAHTASQQSWQQSANVDAAALHSLTKERDALQLQVHSLQVAGNHDADELRRKLARLEVQVESLSSSKREAEERIRRLTQDLGALRKSLGDKEAQMEAMRLALEDAKKAAAQAAEMQHQAETQAAQTERARLAAVAEADKARAAAEGERTRATVALAAEAARAAAAATAEAEAEKARAAAAAEAEKAHAAAAAKKAREEAAAEVEQQAAELNRMQAEVERLEKDLEARNAEYAGLYDYCGQVIGERDAAVEEREAFSASAAAAAAEVAALRQEVEELREELADKEQRLAVKPKMAELQYRINELSAQLADLSTERDTAVAEINQLTQKLQEETEAHFQTDGRRVRLGEEVERLRGILKMYSIPF